MSRKRLAREIELPEIGGREYGDAVADVLLYLASEKGNKPLPNRSEVMLACFVNAICEYCCGEKDQIPYEHYDYAGFSRLVNRKLDCALSQCGAKLTSELRASFKKFFTQHFRSDHGEKWYDSGFAAWFQSKPTPFVEHTWELTVPFAKDIETKISPLLDGETVGFLEAIGRLLGRQFEKFLGD